MYYWVQVHDFPRGELHVRGSTDSTECGSKMQATGLSVVDVLPPRQGLSIKRGL